MDGRSPTSISPQTLYARLGVASAPIVVDVRQAPAFEADDTMIVGALRRAPEAVARWRRDLPPGGSVVAYCVHGHKVSGALAVLDAASGAKTGEIPLAAHPESFQLEPNGSRIFVNLPDARQIANWGLPEARANFPMVVDDTGECLAVVYREPAQLAVFDTRTGAVVAQLPTCGDADDVFFDAKRQHLYITCGAGAVAVVQRQGDTYRELERIPTAPGARTSLWVPEFDRLFVAVRARGAQGAALWVFDRPQRHDGLAGLGFALVPGALVRVQVGANPRRRL